MGDIQDNTINDNTYGIYIDESGYSGLSGQSGYSGWSGWSGLSGASGISGFSGAGSPPTYFEVSETAWTNATPGSWQDLLSFTITVNRAVVIDAYGGFQYLVDANPSDVAIRLLLDGVGHEGGSRTLNSPNGEYGYHNTSVLWSAASRVNAYTVQMQYSCASAMSMSNRMLKTITEAL